MLHYISLPTWLITRAVVPYLPEVHIWYNVRFKLKYWNRFQSWTARVFDVIMWVNVLTIVLLLSMV